MHRVVTLEDALSMALMRVFLVRLRDMQKTALVFLFDRNNINRKLLLVAKTGGRKTHVIRIVDTMLKGVHLTIHPLLVLTADQNTNSCNLSRI